MSSISSIKSSKAYLRLDYGGLGWFGKSAISIDVIYDGI